MKLHNKPIPKPPVEILPLVREGGNIIIKIAPLSNLEEFEKLVPDPQPPMVKRADGTTYPDLSNPDFLKKVSDVSKLRLAYMVIKGLEATDGLTWDTVILGDPTTWLNYETELQNSGFSAIESLRIINVVNEVNSLNEKKIEEARKSFLAGL